MSSISAMWLGAMIAWTPNLLFLVIVLYRDWQEQQEQNNHRREKSG
jgi:hypothetical protein